MKGELQAAGTGIVGTGRIFLRSKVVVVSVRRATGERHTSAFGLKPACWLTTIDRLRLAA